MSVLVTVKFPGDTATFRQALVDRADEVREESSASTGAAASTAAARAASPVMCRSSPAGAARLATSRQKSTAFGDDDHVRGLRPAFRRPPPWPIGTSQVPPPGPVSTRCRLVGSSTPVRAAACGSSRAATSVIRLERGGIGYRRRQRRPPGGCRCRGPTARTPGRRGGGSAGCAGRAPRPRRPGRRPARQLEGAVGRLPPLLPGLRGRPPGLADRRGLRRRHVVGRGHGRVPGQAAVHVFLDAGEMTDQALHVQVAQRRAAPSPRRAAPAAARAKALGRAAISLIGGDRLGHGVGTAGGAAPAGRPR